MCTDSTQAALATTHHDEADARGVAGGDGGGGGGAEGVVKGQEA